MPGEGFQTFSGRRRFLEAVSLGPPIMGGPLLSRGILPAPPQQATMRFTPFSSTLVVSGITVWKEPSAARAG